MPRPLSTIQKTLTLQLYNKGILALLTVIGLPFLVACSQNDTRSDTSYSNEKTTPTKVSSHSYVEELLKAEFILQRKGPNEAFEPFYELASKSKNTDLIERLVHIAIATQNDTYVERSTNLWLSIEPASEPAYSLKFQVLIKTKRPEESATLLTNAARHNVPLRFLPVYLEDNLNNNEHLETIADTIATLPPETKSDQYVQLSNAHLLLLSGQYQAAIETSKQLLAKNSTEKNEALYLILALSQKNLGALENAINTLTMASQTLPDNTRILTPLLNFLVENKQVAQAKEAYQKANLDTSDRLQVAVNFMRVLLEYKHPKQTLDVSNTLPEEKLGFLDQIQYLTAIALAQLDKKLEARVTMGKVDGHLRNNATHKIAIWLYDEGKENDVNDLVLTRTLREDMPEQVSFISLLHEEKGNLNLSYDLVFRAGEALPESDLLRYKKALLAETLGNWKITEIELKKLLQKDPDNPQYLNALGYTLLTRTKRIDEAMIYIESAYEKTENDPAITDSLGWGHFMKGELEQASYFLKKAWSILPDAEIAAHYGESLWKQRHYNEAIEIWKTALITSPNSPLLLDTIKRLSPSLLEAKQ
ncbi:tetratricopeptide repeat protein [Marinomonas ushuaiensis]|uniref:tetratricopeptide repeat protein n=1 Tax=Marinomonas ushuaiensis TaxID=263818 RepID=UPI0004B9DCCD|nr:tetratricopeptide repeat protein [Marinomonas ushuaiensis]